MQLEQYNLSVSLPNVITGTDHSVHFPSDVVPFCVPFETDWGDISLEVGSKAVREPVDAG